MNQDFTLIDWSKYFDSSKWMKDVKMPALDVESLANAQRKTVDAVTQANKAAFEGMQALARRQTEIMTDAVNHMADGVKTMISAKTPEENIAKQAELAKKTVEQAFSHSREMIEMVSKATDAAFAPLHQRWLAGFDEFKSVVNSQQTKAAKAAKAVAE